MNKHSKFRTWLHEIWLQNCDEHREYQSAPLPIEVYFRQYKYWLKREFRRQLREQND